MNILIALALWLTAALAVAVWGHFKTERIDRPAFTQTLLYCLWAWPFVLGVEAWSRWKKAH